MNMADDKYSNKTFDALNARGLAGKRDYVGSLEHRKDAEALTLLVECLCDESWYLRELAEEALLRLGVRSGHALLPLLDQGLWFSRASAARVLGRIGFGPAVPALLKLVADSNETVAEAARLALIELGHRGGSMRIAWDLQRVAPEVRRVRLEEFAARDRALYERISRLMRNEELMSVEAVDDLNDDSPTVRASEEGVEWEVLTGPPPPRTGQPEAGGGSDGGVRG